PLRIHFGLPADRLGPSALAIGSFDGVHLGHRSVLERLGAVARAEGLEAACVTFDPHPRCVLDPANCPAQITTLEERLQLVRPLGEAEKANRLLGREFAMAGVVEPGDRIGRDIGWPTVNLAVPPSKLVPGRGIYAGWADTPHGTFQAAISVGYRPTFHKTQLRVEAYLLDFTGDLYQQRLELP